MVNPSDSSTVISINNDFSSLKKLNNIDITIGRFVGPTDIIQNKLDIKIKLPSNMKVNLKVTALLNKMEFNDIKNIMC